MSTKPILQQALDRERRGDLIGAMSVYRALLEREPNNINALYLLGRAHCQRGEFRPCLEAVRKVVTLAPRHAPAHNLVGVALSQTGNPMQAVAAFERALAADENFAPAAANLGDALAALGRHADAVMQFDRGLALDAGNMAAWCNRGLALEALGRDADAAASFERALTLQPDVAEVHFNLGNVLVRLQRADTALPHYRRAIELKPDLVPAHYHLGRLLWLAEDYEQSLASFERALALDPKHSGALGSKARVLFTLGRLGEARALIEQAIALDPRDAASYLTLSRVKRFHPGDPQIAAMERLLPALDSQPIEQRSDLHFALAKAYGDTGDSQSAFAHLIKANALKRAQFDYSEAALIGCLERIARVFAPDLMRAKAGRGDPSPQPIFIVGMPRSGTTLIEQILASHPRVHGAGERDDFQTAVVAVSGRADYPELVPDLAPAQFGAIGEAYRTHVSAAAPPSEYFTDKMPANFTYAGLIHLALPNARIVHVRRDPVDTCLSCFSTSFRASQKFTYDLGELGRFYRAYARLMEHWRQVLPAGVMLELRYEDMVADTEGQTRRLLAHCGLEWDDACLDFYKSERPVHTASAAQVRQPIYTSSIGRWRPYPTQLQPLFEALGIKPDEP